MALVLNDLSHYLLLGGPVRSHDKQQRIFRVIIILASILGLQDIAVKRFCGTIVYEERGCLLHDAPSPRVVPSLHHTYSQKWIAVARAASLAALIAQSSVFRSLVLSCVC